MANKSVEMAYASKKIRSSKWLLLLCAASAAVVDILIIVLLFIGGVGAEYFVCPFLLLAFDIIYFVVSLCFTNFRFKYSILVWVSYIVFFTVGMAIGSAILLGGSGTVITNPAIGLWAGVHIFNIVCAVITALYASHLIKKLWVALAVALVFLSGCAFYAGYSLTEGFFGQGIGTRTIVYQLSEDKQSYLVLDVLSGRSGTVDIPQTFNGKPVTALHCQALTRPNISEVIINQYLEITGTDYLSGRFDFSGINLKVDKNVVNDIRDSFIGLGKDSHSETTKENAVALVNSVVPAGLEDGEGYICFNYDLRAFDASKGNLIPVFVGDLSTFNLIDYAEDFDYFEHREGGLVLDYDWAHRNGGYILSDVAGSNGSLINAQATESTVAQVKFEKVYRVVVESGNDTKYDLHVKQPELCFDKLDEHYAAYRYFTEKSAKGFTDGLTPRKGFTSDWVYYDDNDDEVKFTDLSDVLKTLDGSELVLSTRWALKAPTVSVSTTAQDNKITYGEDVTVSSTVTLEAEGVTPEYFWQLNGEDKQSWTSDEVALTRPKPSEYNGTYTLTVSVNGGETTSLTAQTTASVRLAIDRKSVSFEWTKPEDLVYDGTEKTVTLDFDRSQLVENEQFDYDINNGLNGTFTAKNAGTYELAASVTGYPSDFYECYKTENTSCKLTITKCSVSVNWSGYANLVYNAAEQKPAATATGVGDDGEIITGVRGGQINAGEHTATAYTENSNYSLSNATCKFRIDKKPLKISSRGVIVAYGKVEPHIVNVTKDQCEGFEGNDDVNSLNGTAWERYEGKDFGEYPEGVILWGLSSNNYDIEFIPGKLTVGMHTIQLEWSGTENLVYDGTPKNVTAVVAEKGYEDDDIKVRVIGGNETDAGEHEATVVIDENCASATNYSLRFTSNKKITYTIKKAKATITPDKKTVNYGDAPVPLTATVTGLIGDDELEYTLTREEGDTVGLYTITVELTKPNPNYDVTLGTGIYSIGKRSVTADWSIMQGYKGVTYPIYNGQEYTVSATVLKMPGTDLQHCYVGETRAATNAGTYRAKLEFDDYIKQNYSINNVYFEYKIAKADHSIIYYINDVATGEHENGGTDGLRADYGDVLTWESSTGNATVTVDGLSLAIDSYRFDKAGRVTFTFVLAEDENHYSNTFTLYVDVSAIKQQEISNGLK